MVVMRALGGRFGAPILLSDSTLDDSGAPAVAIDGQGDFVGAWQSDRGLRAATGTIVAGSETSRLVDPSPARARLGPALQYDLAIAIGDGRAVVAKSRVTHQSPGDDT
jgi:hypothetical protein